MKPYKVSIILFINKKVQCVQQMQILKFYKKQQSVL